MAQTLTDASPDAVDEKLATYRELAAEAVALRQRIARAERERGTVSERIYQKVRREYTERLDAVEARLEPLREQLERRVEAWRRERDTLAEAVESLSDELAEAEFRHRVGEHDAEWFDAVRDRVEPELEDKRARLEETERLLADWDAAADGRPAEGDGRSDPPRDGDSAGPAAAEAAGGVDDDRAREPGPGDGTDAAAAAGTPPADAETPAPPSGGAASGDGAPAEGFENPQAWADELDDPVEDLADLADPVDGEDASAGASTGGAPSDGDAGSGADAPSACPILVEEATGRRIPLLPLTMTIGREHDNNVEVKDPDVARYHARILYEDGRYVLEALENSSGTWLNGDRIRRAPLADGDRIRVGGTELVLRYE